MHTERDAQFSQCDKVHRGFVDCAECLPCEKEVAVFDSCGFMTGRHCVKVNFIEEVTKANCKVNIQVECWSAHVPSSKVLIRVLLTAPVTPRFSDRGLSFGNPKLLRIT